jgi:Ca-activated chloride channel family protein
MAPDLFAEQPLVLFGRKRDSTAGNLSITGSAAGGNHYEKTFNLRFEETGNPAIAQLWGRSRIKDLTKEMVGVETKAGVEAVTDTALTYQLLSQYTAFVAVSDDVRVNPQDASLSMQVPVEMPEGVSYQGTIGSMPTYVPRAVRLERRARTRIVSKTLIDPSLVEEEHELFTLAEGYDHAPTRASLPLQLQIVSVTGLDAAATASLTQYLQQLNLPVGFSGEIVFEFSVQKGRVKRVVLDEKASTLKEAAVIERIKRSLLSWQVPQSTTGAVRLTLHIQS